MDQLKTEIGSLPTTMGDGINYLSYQVVTNQVAAFLLPGVFAEEIGGADYQQILETADTFRIKIWYEQDGNEVVVYDNGFNQPIGGGNIIIHDQRCSGYLSWKIR